MVYDFIFTCTVSGYWLHLNKLEGSLMQAYYRLQIYAIDVSTLQFVGNFFSFSVKIAHHPHPYTHTHTHTHSRTHTCTHTHRHTHACTHTHKRTHTPTCHCNYFSISTRQTS